MTEKVLVTGGFGLVGSQTVRRLVDDGHRVVVTDLGTPAQRKAATSLPANADWDHSRARSRNTDTTRQWVS